MNSNFENHFFSKWGYSDISNKVLDTYSSIIQYNINTFADRVLLKQQIQLFEQQEEQLEQQIQIREENLNCLKELNLNLQGLIDEQTLKIQNQIQIETQTNEELQQYKLQIKNESLINIDIENVNKQSELIMQSLIWKQKVDQKREMLFGKGYNLQPPLNYKEALRENTELKQQMHTLENEIQKLNTVKQNEFQ